MKTDSLKVSAVIPAPPEAVYKAWLSGSEHGEMTRTPEAQIAARVGGKFTTEFPEEAPDSRLEVVLEKARGGTKITILQTEIPAGQGAGYRQGWIDYFTPMKQYFAEKGGKG